MSTTTAVPTQKAKLSCNHVVPVGPEVKVGDRLPGCEKCQAAKPNLATRSRAVKALTPLAPAAWAPVATDTGVEHGPFRCLAREAAAQPGASQKVRDLADDLAAGRRVEADRAARAAAARTEHAAVTAWVKAGRKGPQPATPNLDALQADNAPGTAGRRPRRQPAQPRQPRTVAFTINGHVLNKSNQVVSSLAWQATKGLGQDGGRLTTTQLRELLAAEGLTDLESGPWSFTLANGKTIGAQSKEA